MACNCSKNKAAKKETYQWTSPSGEVKTYSTKDAAVLKTARDGGKWRAVTV